MAWFRRRKSPFAHEIDDFHRPQPVARVAARVMVTGTSEAAKEGKRSSDLTIAALGVTLGLICALFPWYIFFNQEKFGIRAMQFEGNTEPISGPLTLGPLPDRVGAPMNVDEVPMMNLDLFSTGTTKHDDEAEGDEKAPGVDEQPFPVEVPQFRLVHVANGRAMIADDTGLWVVQRGSILPDSSRVKTIEQRDGQWVIVTSEDRLVPLTP
jgi:hypothetical protein